MKGRKPKPAAIRKLEGTLTPKHQQILDDIRGGR